MTIQIANIIFYSLTLLSSIAQLCISVYVLLLMIIRRQIIRKHRIDYLLFANTYVAELFVAIFFIDMCVYSIYGQMHVDISFNGWYCKIKSYIMYFSGCTFFYTFALQASYRLCRILYRAKVRLHSLHLYTVLSVGLWILTSCELLPSLLINDIKYIPNDYHCQFAPTDMRGSFTIYSVGFLLPFIVTICCYMWTMYNIRQQTIVLVTINQQTSMRRDIIVLKRLMIFLTIVTIVAAPHILLPIVYIIIGSLPEWIISVEWLITTLALLAVAIISLFTAPHLKKLWIGSQAIHPNGTVTMIALQR